MEDKMDTEFRRIFLKFIVLKIISDTATHGYEIIRTVELRSGGRWKPSAGSIYPILESLESTGCIRSEEIDRRKVYTITPKGVTALDRMTQKKRELMREMTMVIDAVTSEGNDVDGGQ